VTRKDERTEAFPAACDIAVIGAGPAGMAAAIEARRHGLAVIVFDEQGAAGGQIYRAIGETPVRRREVLGGDYWHGATLTEALARSGAHHARRTTVWSVARNDAGGFEIGLSCDGAARLVNASQVIVATGALERPFPVPGWTLPGVMTAGAAQILLKTAGLVPGPGTVIAGSGPLLYLLMAQFALAGMQPAAVLDATPAGRWRDALPHAIDFALSPYWRKGVALLRQARRGHTIVRHVESLEVLGDGKAEAVRFSAGGVARELPCELVLLHQGVVPNLNLANAIGCEQRWDDVQKCFAPVVDEWGASTVKGVWIAGDGAGIAGARAAESHGRIAALHAAFVSGRIGAAARDAAAVPHRAQRARWQRGRAFLDALYAPAPGFRLPAGDTVVCRCEEVVAQQVTDTVKLGCTGPNQMKTFLRCGMGPCQGRLCGLTVSELIARERGVSPAEVGYYHLRFPIKPITLGELASLPQTDVSEQAVVRLPQ
jgi:NADPH-dependent 2,4-dienoyl-CoA reductase/sulfur reductase-like enzyme